MLLKIFGHCFERCSNVAFKMRFKKKKWFKTSKPVWKNLTLSSPFGDNLST